MASQHQPVKRKGRPCDACVCYPKSIPKACSSADAISHTEEEEESIHSPDSLKRKHAEDKGERVPPKTRHSNSSSRNTRSPETQNRIIRTTSGSGVEEYDDLEGPSLLKKTLGLQNKHYSQYVGATRGIEPSLLGSIAIGTSETDVVQLADSTLRRVSSTEAFLLFPDPGTQGYSDELEDLDAIEGIVEPHGKALVDMYFRIVFPSFPIIHKEVYLEKYGRSYREFSPPLLASVYLLALHYWSYEEELNASTKPDMKRLEKLARKALADTIHRPKLSTVQAGLLFLQHSDEDSAELTAQLVSIGYGLGLNLDASGWNIPEWEKGLRKRLGWGLFMQDVWSSLGNGRVSLIHSSNWALQPVLHSDFPEDASHEDDKEGSSEVETGRTLFTHMIALSIILADLLESVFTVKATREISVAGANGISIILDKVKPIQLRLKEWFSNLPDCLSMGSTQPLKLNSAGYLRLAYIATEITLHRRILLSLQPSTSPELIIICRSVAHERLIFAMDFVQSLKPQHLSSFWYFASPRNFSLIAVFGTILLSSAKTPEEEVFYRARLREYRWMLKINSENGARYMRPAMALLDANLRLLVEANSKNDPKCAVTKIIMLQEANSRYSSEVASHTPQSTKSDFNPPSISDFNSPGQGVFASQYTDLHRQGETPIDLPSGNNDEQSEGLGYGLRSLTDTWS